jgi:hypothetical protein
MTMNWRVIKPLSLVVTRVEGDRVRTVTYSARNRRLELIVKKYFGNLGWNISNSLAISHELYSCHAAAAVVAFVFLGVPTVPGRYACICALGVAYLLL